MYEEYYEEISDDNSDYKIGKPLDEITKRFLQVDYCGTQKIIDDKIITFYCRKQICDKCGGNGNRIHKLRFRRILEKLGNIENLYIRSFVFTVPIELRRKYFMSRNALKSLLAIVNRIITKNFGVLSRVKNTKKGKEKVFRLDKKVFATLELFGKTYIYNPHVNVLIFEDIKDKDIARLTPQKLERIRKSYKKALSSFIGKPINTVVVHYEFIIPEKKKKPKKCNMVRS